MYWIKFLIFKLFVYTHFIQTVYCLRLLMLDIPSPTIFGESVELQCSYELDEDQLYSVKWYKNDVEFYRYVPNDWPPGQFLPIPGIRVDLSRSGKDYVYLRQVDLKSEGMYRCEVSAEAPEFKTGELEKEMRVFLLPTEGPRITNSKSKYQVGDEVKINCTSALSKPAANLKWYINDQQAPTHYEKTYPLKVLSGLSDSGLEQVTLGLHFTINSNHFLRGELQLPSLAMRCTASIARVYAMSTHAFGTLLGVHNHTTRPVHPNDVYKGKHNHNLGLPSKGNGKKDGERKTVTTTKPKLNSAIISASNELHPLNSCLLIGLSIFILIFNSLNNLNDFQLKATFEKQQR